MTSAQGGHTPRFNEQYFELELERLSENGIQTAALLLIRIEGVGSQPLPENDPANLLFLRSAQVFEASVRKNDFLARLSHNEFGLLLSRADTRVAALVSDRLTKVAEKLSRDDETGLSFQFGAASGPTAHTTFAALLQHATKALSQN